ncbi:MAG TPA: hypothetical protein VFB77_05860 [Acidimicrobiales bacterium]|nr:hypothetical protein [Acidimicrobiales bacterium]
MIPSLLLVGLVLAALVRDLRRLALAALLAAVVWGVVVGVGGGSLATFVVGTGLGLANVTVGAAVGAAGGAVVRLAVAR